MFPGAGRHRLAASGPALDDLFAALVRRRAEFPNEPETLVRWIVERTGHGAADRHARRIAMPDRDASDTGRLPI